LALFVFGQPASATHDVPHVSNSKSLLLFCCCCCFCCY